MTTYKKSQVGDLWEHEPTGAVFIAEQETIGCDGCAGDKSKGNPVCDVLPSGCSSSAIIWKPTNHQAEALASILRIQDDDH